VRVESESVIKWRKVLLKIKMGHITHYASKVQTF